MRRNYFKHGCGLSGSVYLLLGFAVLIGACGKDDRYTVDLAGVSNQISPACLDVRASGPFLSVQSCGVTVGSVLEEITRQRGLVVRSKRLLDERIIIDFDDLTLADAVARILRNHSYVLRSGSPSQPDTLWVFAREPERGHAAANNTPPLHAALMSPDARVRIEAVSGMTTADSDWAHAKLAELALNDQNLAVREEAVNAVAEIDGTSAMPVLQQAMFDPSPRIRAAALDALSGLGGDEVATVLAFALQDEDATIRLAAVDALGEIGGAAGSHFLHQALADEFGVVSESASAWLVELSQKNP